MNFFPLGYFYIKDPATGEVMKSESTSDNAIMEMPKNCRWLDPGRYLKWSGDMLVNDEGKFLKADFEGELRVLCDVFMSDVLSTRRNPT